MDLGAPLTPVTLGRSVSDQITPAHLLDRERILIDTSRVVLLLLRHLHTNRHLVEPSRGIRWRRVVLELFVLVILAGRLIRRARSRRGPRPRSRLWQPVLGIVYVGSKSLTGFRLVHGPALEMHLGHLGSFSLPERS